MSNLIKVPSMLIGAAAAVTITNNIIADGNMKANRATKNELGERYLDMYAKNLSSTTESNLLEKIKSKVTRLRLDDSNYPTFVHAKNLVCNWVSETAGSIVPLGLAAGAFLTPIALRPIKPNNKITALALNNPQQKIPLIKTLRANPMVQKLVTPIAAVSAGLLLLGSGKIFLNDVLGIGKTKQY